MNAPDLLLYELAGADPGLRFSPHCWKTRMALAHKGLTAETRPWRFTDKEAIAATGQGLVPVLLHEGEVLHDSWRIALYLEERFPEQPSLFGGATGLALTHFVNDWADTTLISAIARLVLLDVHAVAHEKDRDYFRTSRESRFGMSLEEVVADRPSHLAEARRALLPLRRLLKAQPFLAGAAPAYADYCVFGMFMWIRCCSDVELLEAGDPAFAWRERLLDAFDGLARQAPAIGGR